MTPYEIDILLHYHSWASDWAGPSFGSELYKSTITRFIKLGLLVETSDEADSIDAKYQATARLLAYVEKLGKVELPTQIWV